MEKNIVTSFERWFLGDYCLRLFSIEVVPVLVSYNKEMGTFKNYFILFLYVASKVENNSINAYKMYGSKLVCIERKVVDEISGKAGCHTSRILYGTFKPYKSKLYHSHHVAIRKSEPSVIPNRYNG